MTKPENRQPAARLAFGPAATLAVGLTAMAAIGSAAKPSPGVTVAAIGSSAALPVKALVGGAAGPHVQRAVYTAQPRLAAFGVAPPVTLRGHLPERVPIKSGR